MLTVERLEVGYGKATVVWDVSVRVEAGEIVTIIGANGAGKTTILRAVAGLLRPTGGRIAFRGREIVGLAAPVVATLGVALVPEGRELFPHMTVYENLRLGGRRAGRSDPPRRADRAPPPRSPRPRLRARARPCHPRGLGRDAPAPPPGTARLPGRRGVGPHGGLARVIPSNCACR